MPEADNNQQIEKPKARWVTTLSGMWSTETYGVVQFLRVHLFCRRIVAFVGVLCCITAVATLGGLKIPGFTMGFFPFFIVGPWLVYVATISGPHFEVTFPPRQAAQEREKAEKKFEESKTVEDALKLDL